MSESLERKQISTTKADLYGYNVTEGVALRAGVSLAGYGATLLTARRRGAVTWLSMKIHER